MPASRPSSLALPPNDSPSSGAPNRSSRSRAAAGAPELFLVDTSVWGHHLKRKDDGLVSLLEEGAVLTHPAVVGELALANLRKRAEILILLGHVPRAKIATDAEVMSLVERRSLQGRGIGWVDAHLLASSLLTGCGLWTADRPLLAAALHLRIETHRG